MNKSVNGSAPKTDTELFVACINLKWPDTGDHNRAMEAILANPKVKRKIDFESRRLAGLNGELDRRDLREEIKTILFLAIKNEFSLALDPMRMEGWLCARIAWRTLDHIARECELVYEQGEDSRYTRIEKVSLAMPDMISYNDQNTNGKRHSINHHEPVGDMITASAKNHDTFDSFLRSAKIKLQYKHIIMYVYAMGYNFKELAELYGVSSPTARKFYRRAIESLRRYISTMTPGEQDMVKGLLGGLQSG